MAIQRLNITAAAKAVTASDVQTLDFERILPFACKPFNLSPNVSDYHFSVVPILTSDLPNRNGIGIPLAELVRWNPELGRQGYKGWAGMPLHYEHKSEIHEEAIGIIADVALVPAEGYNGGRIYKVMALAAVDTTKRTDVTSRIVSGDLTTWSMGCMISTYTCSLCGKEEGDCRHINPKTPVEFYEENGILVFRNVHEIKPFELSAVCDPAYPSAISNHDWNTELTNAFRNR